MCVQAQLLCPLDLCKPLQVGLTKIIGSSYPPPGGYFKYYTL